MAKPPPGTHETYDSHPVKLGSDRGFGLVFTVVFVIVGGIAMWRESSLALTWFGASAAVFGVSLAAPRLLRPLNRVWHQIGLALGRVTTPVVLALLFFLVVTPTGLVARMLGKDRLGLKPDPAADSYWIHRNPPGPDPRSMTQQF
jgi:hypothetical protein